MHSEHSSYEELKTFVAWINPEQLIPTVDCDTPEKVKAIIAHFKKPSLKDTILPYLQTGFSKIKENWNGLVDYVTPKGRTTTFVFSYSCRYQGCTV